MSATESNQPRNGSTGGSGNPLYYILCVIVGLVAGVLATLGFQGTGGDEENPIVARVNGEPVRAAEAFRNMKTQIYDLEEEVYRAKLQAVNDYIEQRLLIAEAQRQNTTLEQLLEKHGGEDVGEVDDKEVEVFLSSKGLSLEDPRIRKEDVKEYLRYRKKYEQRKTFVDKLKENEKVAILLEPPTPPTVKVETEGYPAWGSANAPVTIVEFSDFQCPFCSRALETIQQVKQHYGPDKVRIVFRDMPLNTHERAVPAALASHCAAEQGKFWEYHDLLFENQSALSDEELKAHAKQLKLDEAKFNECFDSKKYASKVQQSLREAEAAGIEATPTFIVNGVLLPGFQPFERMKEWIDRQLKQSS